MLRLSHASFVAAALLAAGIAACTRNDSIPSPLPANVSDAGRLNGSWMRPEAKKANLLYVADLDKNAILVFRYPSGEHVGTLKGLKRPHGECVDANGNVWVTNNLAQNIVEYAHGGTVPIATLSDPGGSPVGCAVDPTTGNLAVMNFSLGSGAGTVVVYAGAKGATQQLPAPATSSAAIPYRAAYDAKGNLWLEGMNVYANYVAFSEYVANKRQWRSITLKHPVVLPGGIQWLGNELVVGDQGPIDGPSSAYEFSVRGTVGKLIRVTPLKNSCNMLEFVVIGKTLVAANTCVKSVRYFAFPAGGSSTKIVHGGLGEPAGVVLSRP